MDPVERHLRDLELTRQLETQRSSTESIQARDRARMLENLREEKDDMAGRERGAEDAVKEIESQLEVFERYLQMLRTYQGLNDGRDHTDHIRAVRTTIDYKQRMRNIWVDYAWHMRRAKDKLNAAIDLITQPIVQLPAQ